MHVLTPSPPLGSLIVATAWFAIAVLSLIPAASAFVARNFAFPSRTPAGPALAASGLSQGMILAASGDAPAICLPAPGGGAQAGMKVR